MTVYKSITTYYAAGYTLGAASPFLGVYVSATGTIAGSGLALLKQGGVYNKGHITASGSATGVSLDFGGSVRNFATITGSNGLFAGAAATITNSGLIAGYGTNGYGLNLTAGGSVLNKGTIHGAGVGIYARPGGVTTINNYGYIFGGTSALYLANPSDRLIVETGATFGGFVDGGGATLELRAATGSFFGLNSPTAHFTGAASTAGFKNFVFDAATNWTLTGTGTLRSNQTIDNSGSLTIAGTLNSQGYIDGGVAIGGGGSLANSGQMQGGAGTVGAAGLNRGGDGGAGATLGAGQITNSSGGTISGGVGGTGGPGPAGVSPGSGQGGYGGDGVDMNGAGTLLNYGRITGGVGGAGSPAGYDDYPGGNGGVGLHVTADGSVINGGTITGGAGGAGGPGLYGAGPGANGAQGTGVDLDGGASLTNKAGGVISGAIGLYAGVAATVENAGAITGYTGDSVLFGAPGGRLIVDGGAQFMGPIAGGGGTLEFNHGDGQLTGLGGTGVFSVTANGTFTNFAVYQFDSNAIWHLTGANTIIAGASLSNAGSIGDNATLEVDGYLGNTGTLSGRNGAGGVDGLTSFTLTGAGSAYNSGSIFGGAGGYGIAGVTTYDTLAGDGTIGGAGAAGLTISGTATMTNGGRVSGGAGGVGGAGSSGDPFGGSGGGGGAGGAGIDLLSGRLVNTGTVLGGDAGGGGYGGYANYGHGPQGGAAGEAGAAVAITDGVLVNSGAIIGGLGGAGGGGGGGYTGGGPRGASTPGGFGVAMSGAGTVTNTAGGVIQGGAAQGSQGDGGAGASLGGPASPGSLFNDGDILGAAGGGGSGNAGAGGAGLYLLYGSGGSSGGVISGGMGGAGGYGGYSRYTPGNAGTGGVGGLGAELDGGSFQNGGRVEGGAGGAGGLGGASGFLFPTPGGAGATGGAGLQLRSGTFVSSGTVTGGDGGDGGTSGSSGNHPSSGGNAGAGADGAYVIGGLFNNSGLVQGGDGGVGGTGVTDNGFHVGPPGTSGAGGAAAVMIGGAIVNDGTMFGGTGGAPAPLNGVTAGADGDGVDINAATSSFVTNGGTNNHTALIQGAIGVDANAKGAATVANYATITGTIGDSVLFQNASDRLIVGKGADFVGSIEGGGGALEIGSGSDTITGLGGAGTLSGDASGYFSGFATYQVDQGARLELDGVSDVFAGASLIDAGSIFNTGSVLGVGDAILLSATGKVTNASSALVSGVVGIDASKATAGTVENAGTIIGTGGTSVELAHSGDRLIVDGGALFTGSISGGGGTLEIAGAAGTLSGLGGTGTLSVGASATFSGFGAYQLDAGEAWSLVGASTLNAGQSFLVAGQLTVFGSFANYGHVAGAAGADGAAGDAGYAGSTALFLGAGATIANSGTIAGGAGGTGGYSAGGVAGGAGGAGIDPPAVGVIINYSVITGGAGGTGGASGGTGGTGGAGGDGVFENPPSTVINYGLIQGGAGGAAGVGEGAPGYGGAGGIGVALYLGGSLFNSGTIQGGKGGAGSLGGAPGGDGAGVRVEGYASIVNGYAGETTHAVIEGYRGVDTNGAVATIDNYGTIIGDGGYSVFLGNSGDYLQVRDGSAFTGLVFGGNAKIGLMENGGALSGLGNTATVTGAVDLTFTDVRQLLLRAGAWSLSGVNTISSGQTLFDEAATLANAGYFNDFHGGTVFASGVVDNSGTIRLSSSTTNTDLRLFAGGSASLTGHGLVEMTGARARILGGSSASRLTNVDNTIAGSGFIGLGELTLTNAAAGVIDATGAKQTLWVNTGGKTLVNAGLMEASNGATLTLQSATIDQTGGGTISALTGGRVNLEGVTIEGGTLSQAGTGVLNDAVSGGELLGKTAAVHLTGSLQVLNGVTLTLDGAIANAGKIDTFGRTAVSEIVIGADGATLSGQGQINLFANTDNTITGVTSTVTLDNIDNRISGAGAIGGGSMILVNESQGVIAGNSAQTLTIDTGASVIQNGGTIMSAGSGRVIVASAIDNTGMLTAAKGVLEIDGAVSGAGAARIIGAGVLDIAAADGQTVSFAAGSTGELQLTDFKDFTGQVQGLSKTGANTIDLAGFTFIGGATKATYSGTTASGVLTVTNGVTTVNITLVGDYIGRNFTVSDDLGGGTLIRDPAASAAPLVQAMAAHSPPPPAAPVSGASIAGGLHTLALPAVARTS